MSSSEETSSFQPKESKPFSRCQENIRLGRQGTVAHRMMVPVTTLDSDWPTSAQTPNPAYAIAMPTTAEASVLPIVEKKNRLNSRCRDTYDCWMLRTPETTTVRLSARTSAVRAGSP